jgi:hypothetical protein
MRIQDPALADIGGHFSSGSAILICLSVLYTIAVVACLIVHCPPGVPEVIKSRGEKNVPS